MYRYHMKDMARYDNFNFSISCSYLSEDGEPHTHDFNELEIILSGTASNRAGNQEFPVSEGDVFVIGKDTSHEIRRVNGLKLYNIVYDAAALQELSPELRGLPGFLALFSLDELYLDRCRSRMKLSGVTLEKIRVLLDEMYSEYISGEPGFKTMIICDFTRLLLMLSRAYEKEDNGGTIPRIAGAFAFIERHYLEEINVRELAELLYMSERNFRRLFSKVYGVPPLEYVLSLRLDHACALLRSSELTVTEIALGSGFSDNNYFTRYFRQKTGVTPTAYRARFNNIYFD